jgi:DNA-binding MarR family transcriptional regulator
MTGETKSRRNILDYLTFRLDVLNTKTKASGTLVYEQACGVSLRDLRVLRFVELEPNLTLRRLIELTMIEKTLLSKSVTSLVKRGLLTRHVDPGDARHLNLRLTRRGIEKVNKANALADEMERAMLAVLTREEREVLDRSIRKLTLRADELHLQHYAAMRRSEAVVSHA